MVKPPPGMKAMPAVAAPWPSGGSTPQPATAAPDLPDPEPKTRKATSRALAAVPAEARTSDRRVMVRQSVRAKAGQPLREQEGDGDARAEILRSGIAAFGPIADATMQPDRLPADLHQLAGRQIDRHGPGLALQVGACLRV